MLSRNGRHLPQRPPEPDLSDLIRRDCPLAPVPAVPEIRLHRATPSSGLWRLTAGDTPPYWAYLWPGGMALARHILDRPEIVADRRVLDLGAGGGIGAIAAAKAGAREIIAAEIDSVGAAALALNAEANDVTLRIVTEDLTPGRPPPVDLILVGDLFYERRLAKGVTAFLERCRTAGITVLIGDIGRLFLPRRLLHPLAEYAVADFGENAAKARPCGVYSFGDPVFKPRRPSPLPPSSRAR